MGRKAKNNKNKALKMFVKGFLVSFFVVAILLGVGVLSYQATMYFGKSTDDNVIVAYKEQEKPEPITEASVDDVSKNLIYRYNEDTNEISKIVLEIFHCEKKQLTYITIPIRTQFTMSDSLYRKLVLVHPAIPQMIKLSSMTNYFDKDTVFDYGVQMVEDMLGIDISYYTAIPQSTYDDLFTEQYIIPKGSESVGETIDGTEESTNEKSSDEKSADQGKELTVPVETFTQEYMDFISTLQTAEEVSTYIEEIYPLLQSNLSLNEKMNYLESYCNTPITNISFDQIKGDNLNSAFVINQELATRQLGLLTAQSIAD